MAGIFANVDSDIQKLQKLKQEIENVKKSLKSINVKVDIDIAQGLEAQLKSLTTQYDALAAKVGETEARITASANKIINASNKIIQAQDKMSQAAGINTPSSTNTNSSTDASETTSIQAQVKAYEELKAEIGDVLGTRGQNIKRLIEEQNAIRLLNAEIKKITKSQGESSSLSSSQQRRLEQLNNSLLTHKTALAEVRQSLSANAKLDNAAATSMDALSQSLGRMRAAYRALTESERTSPFGKELLVSIQQADAKIKELDATIGNHQRNVGNYASAWNGLGNSVQQVARELPSLAVSANTFFLAISNNLPILVDEIAKARKEYANFKAELKAGNKDVKAVAPVWQQLTRSILSWQTALVVGLTLLSVYGKDVIKWIGSLGKARDVTLDLLSAEQEMALARKSAWSSIAKEQTQLDILYNKLKNVTLSTTERNAAVREWVKNYKTHSDILDGENVDLRKLENAYRALSKEIYANAVARAYADRIAELSVQREKEEMKRLNQKLTIAKAEQELERVTAEYNKKANEGFGTATAKLEAKDKIIQARKNVEDQKKIYNDLVNNVNDYDKNITVISNHIKTLDLFPQPKEGTYDYWQQQVEIADNALKQITSEQKKVLDEASKNSKKDLYGLGIDRDVVDSYNKAVKDKAEAEKQLKVYGDSSKEQKMAEKEAEKRKKEQEKLNEELLSLRRQNQQAEIDLMEDGTEKKLKQIDLDYQKEIDAIKKQKASWESSQGGKLTDEQTNLLGIRASNAKDKREKGISDVTKELNSILDKYRDYSAQRIAIEKQYQDDEKKLRDGLAKAKSDSEKKQYEDALKELEKQRKKTIDSISKSEIEDSGIWKMLMGDVDALPTDTLEKLLSDAEQLVKTTNLSATDMKAMMDTINNARQNLIARNPFKTLKEEYEKYQKAIKKGDKQGAFTSWSNVEQASESIKSNISTLGASLSSLGTTFSDELGEGIQKAVDVINDGITAFEVFGKTGEKSAGDTVKGISGIVGIITTLVGTVMNAFDSTKAEQERNIEYQRRQEGYWDSINYQVERYLELLKEAAGNDYFATATQSLTTLEKAREKAYKDIVKSMPVGDVDYTTFGLYQLLNYGKFLNKMLENNFGGKNSKEIFDFIQANGGYDLENKLISEEAIWAMKSNADIWSKLPEWMQNAIDKFVELNDQAKELEETLNEDLFQTTSQGIEDAILEGLKGGKRGIADFGEDFEEIMRNALLQSFVIDQLRGKAQEFYKKYTLLADSDENGKLDLTAEEISDLREDWNDIIRAATEEARNIDAIVGGSSSSSQEASKKGFATASQDSIDELNGRFTALQIAGEEIKNQNQLQTMSILELRADMLPIIANTTGIKDIASETRDLLRLSYEELTGIHDDTTSMNKSLKNIETDIAEVKRNTSKL